MSNLSEEEIIKNLNNVLEKWQEIIKMEDKEEREIEMSMYFEEMPFYEIQGLLDLYNKEKEKNKECIKTGDLERAVGFLMNNNDLSNYISKDKIRETIKELEGQEFWYIQNKGLDELYGRIDMLKELLEEE